MSSIRVVRKRGLAGQAKKVKAVIMSMGLRRTGQARVYKDTNCIRGMVNKIKHLIEWELIDGGES